MYPPGAYVIVCDGSTSIAIRYSANIVIAVTSTGTFIIKKIDKKFKFFACTQENIISLGIHMQDNFTSDELLAVLFQRKYYDHINDILYSNLPQPIAEEIEENFGWLPLHKLPVRKF